MSQENVETVRETLEAFDRRDRAAWLALRDPDCEVMPSAMWPEADAARLIEAEKQRRPRREHKPVRRYLP